MKKPLVRTRYERMSLATQLAEKLQEHSDPYVQAMGISIKYTLAARISTLNKVIDQFPEQELIRKVLRVHGLPLKRSA